MRAMETLALSPTAWKTASPSPGKLWQPTTTATTTNHASQPVSQGRKQSCFFANNAQLFFWRISDQGYSDMYYAGAARAKESALLKIFKNK